MNVSIPDLIIIQLEVFKHYLFHPIYKLLDLYNFYKSFQNYDSVFINFLKKNYPISAVLRNGQSSKIRIERPLRIPWFKLFENGIFGGLDYAVKYDIENEIAIISPIASTTHQTVNFVNCINNGDIWDVFVQDAYKQLPVKDKVVIDIGANIGDSSIYFALQGAKRVIAIEPSPDNYNIARQNILMNNFSHTIELLLAGCGSSSKLITVSKDHLQTESKDHFRDGTQLFIHDHLQTESKDHFRDGTQIQFLDLETILNFNKIASSTVLKLDCEGCEYDTIICSKDTTLRRFSYILIEYHHGYQNLKKKLESSGFNILLIKRKTPTRLHRYMGIIIAWRPQEEV